MSGLTISSGLQLFLSHPENLANPVLKILLILHPENLVNPA